MGLARRGLLTLLGAGVVGAVATRSNSESDRGSEAPRQSTPSATPTATAASTVETVPPRDETAAPTQTDTATTTDTATATTTNGTAGTQTTTTARSRPSYQKIDPTMTNPVSNLRVEHKHWRLFTPYDEDKNEQRLTSHSDWIDTRDAAGFVETEKPKRLIRASLLIRDRAGEVVSADVIDVRLSQGERQRTDFNAPWPGESSVHTSEIRVQEGQLNGDQDR